MFNSYNLSKEEIKLYKNIDFDKLKNMDIREVKREDLVDISKIKIDANLPYQLKILNFLKVIKNPYFFKVGDIIVNTTYNECNNNITIEDCINTHFKN
ncbi:DUF6870 family protein [[Clostridium] colinum]|uniref:DUF6870 family protein n=1 Tax=[Clostridium] colinum TaxID=36835 RepID=UPI002024CF24|nr:hypothetical protein [[Clostridium] colinum]